MVYTFTLIINILLQIAFSSPMSFLWNLAPLWTSLKILYTRHSAGSLVAIDSYFEAPECIAALILIAPAILAPRAVQKLAEQDKVGRENQTEGDISNSNMLAKPFIKIFKILLKFITVITQAIVQMAKGMTDMLNSIYKKALSAILRSAFGVMLVFFFVDGLNIFFAIFLDLADSIDCWELLKLKY